MSIRQLSVNSKPVVIKLQNKEVVASDQEQVVTADEGYNGLESVTVAPISNAIDEDISAENIRSGVEILGVTGTYEGSGLDADLVTFFNNKTGIHTLSDDRVTKIPEYCCAFTSTSYPQLSSVIFDNVTQIGSSAFYNCKNLSTLKFNSLVTLSGDSPFNGCSSITSINDTQFPVLTTLNGAGIFNGMSNLTTISLSNVTSITKQVSASNQKLTSVSFPKLETITSSEYGFAGNNTLSSINMPLLQAIYSSSYLFQNLPSLTSISLPELNDIYASQYLFSGCSNLESVSFPKLETIRSSGSNMFYNCTNLRTVNFPLLTTADTVSRLFYFCNNIESISFPKLESIGNSSTYFIDNCPLLKTVEFPLLEKIGTSSSDFFRSCPLLKCVSFPSLKCGGSYSNTYSLQYASNFFRACSGLETVDFGPDFRYIPYSFSLGQCSVKKIILRSPVVCSCYTNNNSSNGFITTGGYGYHYKGTTDTIYNPTGAKDGYIYVPDNLVDSYKANSAWSYFADRFKGISELNEIPESNIYVLAGTTGNIRRIYTYVESINSVTLTAGSNTEFSISNVSASSDNTFVEFSIDATSSVGDYDTEITVDLDGTNSVTSTVHVHIVSTVMNNTVTESHTSTYYFTNTWTNANGYWKSNNTSNSSYAISKFKIISYGMNYVYLDCFHGGEYDSDYGVISRFGKSLAASYSTVDAAENVAITFKKVLPDPETMVTFNLSQSNGLYAILPNGEFEFEVKYVKDQYKAVSPDDFRFKICFEDTARSE